MNNKGFGIPITFYIIGGLAIAALVMGFWISRDHQKILRLESELGTAKASLAQEKGTAKKQRDADAQAIETYRGLLAECVNKPCENVVLVVDKDAQITVEPCEAPW